MVKGLGYEHISFNLTKIKHPSMSIEKSQHEEFANNDNINDLDNIEMNIKSFHFVFDFQQKS